MSTPLPLTSLVDQGRLDDPLRAHADLRRPRPFRVLFPVLLDGDLVMSPEHLGVAYLVAVLRQAGAECRILEVPNGGDTDRHIEDILGWEPDVVGVTLTTVGIDHATAFGARLRAALGPDTFVVAGGPLATFKGGALLQLSGWEFLDGLVRGEGELPMLRLAEALHTDGRLDAVPNLVFRWGDEIRSTALMSAVHDLNHLPFPARDQFEQHGSRLSPDFSYLRISTSRGCTSFCTFCNAPHARNRVGPTKVWRGADPVHVVDEVERLYSDYGVDTFDFVDSTFEDPGGKQKGKERVAAIAQQILDRDLRIYFNCCMQACNWAEEDRGLIHLLWRAGLEKVLVGIESGSDAGLDLWKKRANVSDNLRTLRLLREQGIYVAFGFISFHPYATFDEIRENFGFLRETMGHNLRRFTTRLELYPGAEVVEQLRDDGLLLSTYDEACNPFGYRYRDERIGLLARSLNLLYRENYEQNCVIDEEPAVFRFETFDIVLHTFFSRLRRQYREHSDAVDILTNAEEQVRGVKHRVTEHNYELVVGFVDAAAEERLRFEDVLGQARRVEQYALDRIEELQNIQLRAGLQLHRAGYSINRAALVGAGR
jgi:anaerobic magnesium-protoporphyrin IX monomethyl ester cyclase